MQEAKAVIFDIDGTLAPEVSWLALTRDLGASVEEHMHIYDSLKNGEVDYVAAKSRLVDLWRATGNANKTFFSQIFNALPLNPVAQKVVRAAQARRVICLITGSMDLYAQIVARKLSVAQWYANTVLHWDGDGNLVDLDYELDQAAKKLAQFEEFCQANDLKAGDCLVVGDGENDERLFAASGHGVLVGGELETQTQAWKRADRLADLEQILQAS